MTSTQTLAVDHACHTVDLAELWQTDWLLGRRYFLSALLLSSIALAIGGMVAIWHYETTTPSKSKAPSAWPQHTALLRDPAKRMLVLFAHPKCPCTKASLTSLAAIASQYQATVTTQVVFLRPAIADASWRTSELCRTAQVNPLLHVAFDDNGGEAIRFGATASGQAFLYESDGKLVFSGGITSPRGDSSANGPASTLLKALGTPATAETQAPVLGCRLRLHSPLPVACPDIARSASQ